MQNIRTQDHQRRRRRMAGDSLLLALSGSWLLLLMLGAALSMTARPAGAQEQESARVAVIVELLEPGVIEHLTQIEGDAARQVAADAQLRRIEVRQNQLAATLSAFDVQELYRVQRIYNGIAIRVTPEQLDAIAALPGVANIRPIVAKRPTHARSLPYIGAPALWQGLNQAGVTGEGIKIAIIDTGIDYLHRDFGGPGVGYGDNDVTRIGDVVGFPSAKIVGGYDFSGDRYNADPEDADYQPVPQPDADPYDCYGHGTHVAGTAGGLGVTNDGASYAGPYDENTDLAAMRIAPGVAPGAALYALKVFGCTGASEITDLAIEWAVDPNGDGDFSDRMDVINLSLGSAFGSLADSTALAVERAAALGVIVVASAGNSGDHYYAVGSPSVADHALSVAAVGLSSSNQGAPDQVQPTIAAFSARGPRSDDSMLKPDIAAPGQSIFSAQAGTGSYALALSGTSMAAPHVSGAAALMRELRPDLTVEELKALLMSTSSYPAGSGGLDPATALYGPTRTGAGVIDLRAAAAAPLLAYNMDAPGRVSLSFGVPEVSESLTQTQRIRVVNISTATLVVTPSFEAVSTLPGAALALTSTAPVTLASGESVAIGVRLTVNAGELHHAPDADVRPDEGLPRHWIGEATGFALFAATVPQGEAQPRVRLPIYAAPRPVATLSFPAQVTLDAAHQGRLLISGAGLPNAGDSSGDAARVSAFELSYQRNEETVTADAATDRSRTEVNNPAAYGQVTRVGVAHDFAATRTISDTTLYFAVTTGANWSSPHQLDLSILLDVDGDGADDFRLFSSDNVRYASGRGYSDVFVSALERLDTRTRQIEGLLNVVGPDVADTRLFNSRVMILPVRAASLGLTGDSSRFTYRVETKVREALGVYDTTPPLTFDVRKPGLSLDLAGNGWPLLTPVTSGAAISVTLDPAAFGRNRSEGVLVFSHHNAGERQSHVIQIDFGLQPRIYLPLVMGREVQNE